MANDYCRYIVRRGFNNLPDVNAGDVICPECPSSGSCPGPTGTDFTATVQNSSGTKDTGQLRQQDKDCAACPDGKKGYVIVEVGDGDDGGWI